MQLSPRSWTRDAALATALTVAGQVELVLAGERVAGPDWVQHVAFALMTAPVALRRRAPLAGSLVCSVGLVVQTAAGEAPVASGYLAVLLLLASLGYHASRRDGLLGLAAFLLAGASYELMGNGLNAGDLVVNLVLMVGVWFMARRVRVHADARVQAEVARDRAAREAVAAERVRISRDLHDSVAHALTVMTLQAGAAREQAGTGAVADALGAISDTGRMALGDMHRFLKLLGADRGPESPGLLDLGEMTATAERTGLAVRLETTGDLTAVPASVGSTGYRVVQEALTNAMKHSDAQQAEVRVDVDEAGVRVEVVDDGRARPRLAAGSGQGLAGLRDRVDLFGGTFIAAPGTTGGWQVSAWLPLRAQGV